MPFTKILAALWSPIALFAVAIAFLLAVLFNTIEPLIRWIAG